MANKPYRAGFIAVVGRPNTGKSTLVNALVKEKISIVTSKPQTTRHSILGILTEDHIQAIFVDTPGLQSRAKKLINRTMNKAATASLAGADLILLIVEATGWVKADDLALQRITNTNTPVVLVVNKLDLMKRRVDLLPVIQEYATRGSFEEIVPISARGMKNLDSLMAVIKRFLPESERLFPANAKTDRSIEFRVGEVLREKLLDTLRQEVPYGLAVEVLALEEDADLTRVDAIIWVERDSQQGIVVGRRGERLKHMSTEARLDLEKIFERRFYLRARVKVKENWSDNAMALRQLGYEVPR
jgi:GTP-binding protein Era